MEPAPTDHWPAEPLIPGDWRTLSFADACALIARYTQLEVRSGRDPSACSVEYQRVRALRLLIDSPWLLIEAEAQYADGDRGLLTLLYGPGHRILPMSWDPQLVRAVLWPEVYKPEDSYERSAARMSEYTRLFVSVTNADDGRFLIVDTVEHLSDLYPGGFALESEHVAKIQPIHVDPTDPSIVKIYATTLYGGHLFETRYSVDGQGQVEMIGDAAVCEVGPWHEAVSGPFRILKKDLPNGAA